MKQITIEGIPVTVTYKKIRSMNLYVRTPDGEVHVSVPNRTSDRMVRQFVTSHLPWIVQRRQNIQARCVPQQYVTGETVMVFGVPHTLTVQDGRTKRTCGVYKDGNIVHICDVSGLSDALKDDIANDPNKYYMKPMRITGMESTKDNSIRHPKFIGFRDDIDIKDCSWDKIF